MIFESKSVFMLIYFLKNLLDDNTVNFLDFQMRSIMNWLSKMLESMANAFIHPVKNDLPPSIGAHAYSGIPLKRKMRRRVG